MNKILRLGMAVMMLLPVTNAMAQQHRQCGNERLAQYLSKIPAQKHTENNGTNSSTMAKGTGTIVTIPVVFHVVLNQTQLNAIGGIQGVDARCRSQITALNADFAGLNADSTAIPSVFKSLYGKSNIRFGLAHTDPNNHSTPGYEIRVVPKNGFDETTSSFGSECKHAVDTGMDAWDASRYLNIWIINFLTGSSPSGTLGLTISPQTVIDYPWQFQANETGIQLNFGAFGVSSGTINNTNNYYVNLGGGHYANLGRTLTHEMGHFFNLEHIWGNDGGACPGQPGYADDGIADTPPSADQNFGCPTFPHVSCSVAAPNGDMFMNYMDYSDDICLLMFTQGQVNVMNPLVTSTGTSYTLTQYPALLQYPAGVAGVNHTASEFTVLPNPTTGALTIAFGTAPKDLTGIAVVNMMGQAVSNINAANQDIYHIDLSSFAKGVYFVQCKFSTGTVSQKILLQ